MTDEQGFIQKRLLEIGVTLKPSRFIAGRTADPLRIASA